jgi:hypothetical protein
MTLGPSRHGINQAQDVSPMKPSIVHRVRCATLLVMLGLGATATARAAEARAPTWKVEKREVRFDVQADGSTTTHYDLAHTVLAESAIDNLSEQVISYHERSGKLSEVVAYTRKPDGKHIEVPATNVQVTSHSEVDGLPPAFSDGIDRRLIYPNVAVGDTVVLSYTLRDEKPTFARRFSLMWNFDDEVPTDSAVLTVTAPADFGLQTRSYQLEAAVETPLADGRRQWAWHYQLAKPVDRSEETNLFSRAWHYRDMPMVLVSNFSDYADIAAAYESEAAPRATPTPRIIALAKDIIGAATAPRAKAERLYGWVQKEISFAGNCLAGGDVVPRDTDLILNMKRGDCKDHATLLQALLSSAGIASSQVLINSGEMYELPELPCWQAFNHVINYLPDFKLYVDATSTRDPFGELPIQEHGKSVLMTQAPARVAQTATAPAASNWSRMRNVVTIENDGSMAVASTLEFGGAMAHSMRHSFAEMRKAPDFGRGERIFKHSFERRGYRGTGFYARMDDTAVVADHFSFDVNYRIADYLDTSNLYGVKLDPYFAGPAPIAELAAFAVVDDYAYDFLCSGDRRSEEMQMSFPPSVKLLAVPHDVELVQPDLTYTAHYEQHDNQLRVIRTVTDNSPGPVCAAKQVAQYRAIAAVIKKDMQVQAVYQPR